MDATEKTRYKLVDSLKCLLMQHPLHKISVKDIADNCDVTRQTFYRYFKDKYDCVTWYFKHVTEQSFEKVSDESTLEEALAKKLEMIHQEQTFFSEALKADNQNSLFQYDYESMHSYCSSIIQAKTQQDLDFETDFLLRTYCMGCINMTFDWVKSGLKVSEQELAHLFVLALPENLKQVLSR